MSDEIKYAVPQDKLTEVLVAAFNLSAPQGLGFLHYKPGDAQDELFREDVERAIAESPDKPYCKSIHLDYVQGRACKFNVHYDADGWFIVGPRWYDHSPQALLELVKRCGIVERAKSPA